MLSEDRSLPSLMTSKEVADYLRLPLPTVYYLAKTGQLPCFQVGTRWRFRRMEIDQIRNSSHAPPAVLVVDDDPLLCEVLRESLSRTGCQVSTAGTVGEALSLARQTRFDALLIDLVLGAERGVDLVRELQKSYSLRQMVIITGHPDLLETEPVLELGPITVVLKPFRHAQIVECIEQIVARSLQAAGT